MHKVARTIRKLAFFCGLLLVCGPAVNSLAAGNGPRIFDLSYQPSPFHVGTGIEVVPRLLHGKGQKVRYSCRWFVNGQEIEGADGTTLSGEYFSRGDTVSVEVTAQQGEYRGGVVKSGEIEASNAPPEIVSRPPEQIIQGKFEYRVEAVDADADELSFSLLNAPEGMYLDAEDGTLVWDVAPWTKGNFSVKVLVEDGYGGQAGQEFELTLDYAQGKDAVHE